MNIGTTDKSSVLAHDLVELFQSIIDERGKHQDLQKRITATTDFSNKVVTPKMTKLLYKHCGIKAESIIFHSRCSGNISCLTLLGMDSKDLPKLKNLHTYEQAKKLPFWPGIIAGNAYGDMNYDYTKYTKEQLKDLRQLSSKYNDRLGKLDPKTTFQGKPVSAILSFDLGLTINSDDLAGRQSTPMNAFECAAVMLHEIGHALMLCKVAADQFFRLDHFKGLAEYIATTDKLSVKDKMEITKSNIGLLPPDHIARQALEKLDYDPTGASIWNSIVNTLAGVGMEILFALISAEVVFVGVIWEIMYRLVMNPINDMMRVAGSHSTKKGDVLKTKENRYLQEFDADAYVLRHGLASNLPGALKKIRHNMQLGQFAGTKIDNNYDLVMYYWAMINYNIAMCTWGMSKQDVHGTSQQRIESTLTKSYGLMKNLDLSKDEIKMLIRDHDKLAASSKQAAIFGEEFAAGMALVYDAITDLLLLIVLPIGLGDASKMMRTVNTMKVNYNKLKNNKLYYELLKLKEKRDNA